jgi:hypothetical protein
MTPADLLTEFSIKIHMPPLCEMEKEVTVTFSAWAGPSRKSLSSAPPATRAPCTALRTAVCNQLQQLAEPAEPVAIPLVIVSRITAPPLAAVHAVTFGIIVLKPQPFQTDLLVHLQGLVPTMPEEHLGGMVRIFSVIVSRILSFNLVRHALSPARSYGESAPKTACTNTRIPCLLPPHCQAWECSHFRSPCLTNFSDVVCNILTRDEQRGWRLKASTDGAIKVGHSRRKDSPQREQRGIPA